MSTDIKQLCGSLTPTELKAVFHGYWLAQSAAGPTKIHYTFNIDNALPSLRSQVVFNSPNNFINNVSGTLKQNIHRALQNWRGACGNFVEFVAVDNLPGKGIVFAACDNMANNTYGQALIGSDFSTINGVTLNQVLVCLPSQITSYYAWQTLHHEIGHALGFKHLHEVASIKQRLIETVQGRGCSVMPYSHNITSAINACNDTHYCLGQDYAVVPGPLDSLMCQTLYNNAEVNIPSMITNYYKAMMYGLISGTSEGFLTSLVANLEVNGKTITSPEVAKNIAMVITTLVRNHYAIGNPQINSTLAIATTIAESTHSRYAKQIELLRILVNIASIGYSIYYAFDEDYWLNNIILICVGMLSDIAARTFGHSVGEVTASVSNTIIDVSYQAITTTADYVSSGYNYICSWWNNGNNEREADPINRFDLSLV